MHHPKRQSLFFSATMPDNIVELSSKILTDPVKIEVSPVSSAAETLQQNVYYTNKSTKKELLLHILRNKKEFNKEKQRKKQAFFANRKTSR